MYGVALPENFTFDARLGPKETIPSNIDPSTISFFSEVLSIPLAFFMSHPCATVDAADNSNSVTIASARDLERDSGGWTSVDVFLIRSADMYTPSGHFPVYMNKSATYLIGCDAAACVQRYEPWVVEVANKSTVSPSVLRVVGRGDGSPPLPPSGAIRGAPLANLRYLNTTEKLGPFRIGHDNSVYQIMSDNRRDPHPYFPFPAVGSPCTHPYSISSNPGRLHRLCLSPTAPVLLDTPNFLQAGSLRSVHGLVRRRV